MNHRSPFKKILCPTHNPEFLLIKLNASDLIATFALANINMNENPHPPPGFSTVDEFEERKKRSTLYHYPLPQYPPHFKEFRLSEPMLALLPESLHQTAESNANKGEQFSLEITQYQTQPSFHSSDMAGLLASWTSLDEGLAIMGQELHSKQFYQLQGPD